MPSQRHGYIDSIEGNTIVGWAVGLPGEEQPANLFLFIDNQAVDNFHCSLERPDVSLAGLPGHSAGFRIQIPDALMDGRDHAICVRFNSGEFLRIGNEADGYVNGVTIRLNPLYTIVSNVDGLSNGALRGWVVLSSTIDPVRRGGADIAVRHEGRTIGMIKADRYRPDVGKALDCDPHCGFIFVPPIRYRGGQAFTFEFVLSQFNTNLDGSPVTFQYPAHLPETKLAQLYDTIEGMNAQIWKLRRELRDLLTRHVMTLDDYDGWARQYQAGLRYAQKRRPWPAGTPQPLVSILCPVYRPRIADFRAAVQSVLAQTYANWELLLIDDNSQSEEVSAVLDEFAARDSRIRVLAQTKNGGISRATNIGIDAARGEWIALFDHDDLLEDVAVSVMMEAAHASGAKILYSDEDKIDDFGRFSDPNLKSAWNRRLLMAQNYVCHFLVVDAATLRAAGPLRKKYDGAQDHDLMLRLSEIVTSDQVVHVPEVIYHWRKTPGSTATEIGAKSYAVQAGRNAVLDHLKRRGLSAKVTPMLGVTIYDIAWRFDQEPKVTIIIPFRDQISLTKRCLETLLEVTEYGNYNVILVDNWSTGAESAEFIAGLKNSTKVKVITVQEDFNYSRLNNIACEATDAEFFVFMNNDVFVEQRDWLRRMVDEALADPEVAAVGAKLVFPDRTVQHNSVVLGIGGVGDHAYRGRPETDPFYVGRGVCAHEVSAVTAALMLCRASMFHAVSGFDEKDLAVAYNDVDLCLKLRQAGGTILICPAIIAEHHESVSRGDDMHDDKLRRFVHEESVMFQRWGRALQTDPFYNPNFSLDGGIFDELDSDPFTRGAERTISWRRVEPPQAHGEPNGTERSGMVLRP